MNNLYMCISVSLFSLMTACSQPPSYIVENIEDGDTIIVSLNGKSQRIQLSGIDAPENTENAKFSLDIKVKKLNKEALLALGNKATDYLTSQVAVGQEVLLQGELNKKDKYGRIPAIVLTKEGKSLNLTMVKEGYAVILKRFPLEESFKLSLEEAQQQAITNKKGLWKSDTEITTKWSGT
ncbi:MAG: thermonuclease family protein [Cocleimonas sp.]|nr:thermonuclease family protein [Cocleimonas sp.]